MTEAFSEARSCCFSAGKTVLVTVTEACNQRCLHCMRSARFGAALPLNIDVMETALDRFLAAHSLDRVVISGGEPTLVPNLVSLIAMVDGRGIRSSVCSNGLLMPRWAERYRAAGLRGVTVSLDGFGTHYARWRGGSDGGDRALRGVRASVAAGLRVTVNITLHDAIVEQADQFGARLRSQGLTSVCITSPMTGGRMEQNASSIQRVNRPTVLAFANALRGLVDVPVSVRIPRCDQATCPSGREVYQMDLTGRISGCPDVGARNAIDELAAGYA